MLTSLYIPITLVKILEKLLEGRPKTKFPSRLGKKCPSKDLPRLGWDFLLSPAVVKQIPQLKKSVYRNGVSCGESHRQDRPDQSCTDKQSYKSLGYFYGWDRDALKGLVRLRHTDESDLFRELRSI